MSVTRRQFLGDVSGLLATAASVKWLSFVEVDGLFEADPVEITKNEIRIRVKRPGAFQEGSFRSMTLKGIRGIRVIIGRPKGKTTTETQSFRFDKSIWTAKRAEKWVRDHGHKPI